MRLEFLKLWAQGWSNAILLLCEQMWPPGLAGGAEVAAIRVGSAGDTHLVTRTLPSQRVPDNQDGAPPPGPDQTQARALCGGQDARSWKPGSLQDGCPRSSLRDGASRSYKCSELRSRPCFGPQTAGGWTAFDALGGKRNVTNLV